MTNFTIDNIGNSVLDSRDIQERIVELTFEKESFIESYSNGELKEHENEGGTESNFDRITAEETALKNWLDEHAGQELKKLEDLKEEVDSSEWHHGLTLIHDSYWTKYVKEMLEDCGDIPNDLPHYIAINWDETADNIKADYAEVEIEGATYFFRTW